MRATYDHQGMSDHRADTHTNRLMYPGSTLLPASACDPWPGGWGAGAATAGHV